MLADINTSAFEARFRARFADRWCYLGGEKKTETQQSTTTNTLDPQFKGLVMDNYNTAQGKANSLTPYTGQLTAGFNPTQTQAQGILTNVGTDTQYANSNTAAIDAVKGVLGYDPGSVDPSTIANSDLSQYENPYTKDVINASIDQNERARQIAQVADAQKANAAGAFGGSRSGVMAANTNEGYDRNNQQNIAALNQANFNQAQGAAATDAATKNQVGEFNTTTGLNAAGQRVNAAGQLIADNTAALGTAATQGGILGAVGDAQQGQDQGALDRAYAAYKDGQTLTLEQQQLLNSALGLVPVQQTVAGDSTGTSKTSGGGLGGILGGVGSLFGGAASLWKAI